MPGSGISPGRPGAGEYFPYFAQYIDLVPDGDLIAILRSDLELICDALANVDPEIARRRPSPGEWSPLDIAVHLIDTERVLGFRAFTFERTDEAELPSVDFEQIADAARANERAIGDVVTELRAVRLGTIALFRSFGAEKWTRTGVASGSTISVRALAYVIAGHDLHHLPDLRTARGSGSRQKT